MSKLIDHFNKFEETREQLTERTLDESPTKVKQVLNESNDDELSSLEETKNTLLRRLNDLMVHAKSSNRVKRIDDELSKLSLQIYKLTKL